MKKKVILIPENLNSYISNLEITDIMEDVLSKKFPKWDIKKMPIISGGIGSIDTILSCVKGQKIYCQVKSPLVGEEFISYFGLIDNNETALIEIAATIPEATNYRLVSQTNTSSYAVGELILKALEFPIKKIIIFPYDGISDDWGCGIASSLGVKFFNKNHEEFIPTKATIDQIDDFLLSSYNVRLKELEIILAYSDKTCMNKSVVYGTGFNYLSDMIYKNYNKILNQIDNNLDLSRLLNFFYGCKNINLASIFLDLINFEKEVFHTNYVFYVSDKINDDSFKEQLFNTVYLKSKARKVSMICFTLSYDKKMNQDIKVYEITKRKSINLKVTLKEDIRKLMESILDNL